MRAARRPGPQCRPFQDQVVGVLDQATGAVSACEQVAGQDEIAAVRRLASRQADRWGSLSETVLVPDSQHGLVGLVNDAGGWCCR